LALFAESGSSFARRAAAASSLVCFFFFHWSWDQTISIYADLTQNGLYIRWCLGRSIFLQVLKRVSRQMLLRDLAVGPVADRSVKTRN
jgi:hypothetical protein